MTRRGRLRRARLSGGTPVQTRSHASVPPAVPKLILQGGRDYQVTVADDLPAWREALPTATIKILEADNHLFFPGTGPSTLADYQAAQHVDPEALTTILDWLP